MLDTILVNCTIISMNQESDNNQAMALSDGKIAFIGTREDVEAQKEKNTKVIDCKGKTIIPGLFDAHGHFVISSIAKKYWIDMSCAPLGKICKISDLLNELEIALANRKEDTPIIGFGYDDTLVEEYRMPTAQDLDQVSRDVPIILLHVSLHMVSANTAAMNLVGIVDDTFRPAGGTIYYENGKPVGIFEEASAIEPFMPYIYPEYIYTSGTRFLEQAGNDYLTKGITTCVEGMGTPIMEKVLKEAEESGKLKNRIIVDSTYYDAVFDVPHQAGDAHFINGPVKLFMDGSIQAYTAYLSKPFFKMHPTRKKPKEYRGFPSMSVDELAAIFRKIRKMGHEFAIHCNGDAAIDDVLDAYEKSGVKEWGDARNLIIHCQTEREDQLDRMKQYGLYPSFFAAHIYVWGDRHYDTFLGENRANRLEPMGEASQKEMIFSMHNDAPVTEAKPLGLVWNAVTRKTATGRVLGPEQKISVYEALKAVTINAAYQYHMEDFTGSLEVGKVGDFVVLNRNPLTCTEDELRDIEVEETWVDGEQVYKK